MNFDPLSIRVGDEMPELESPPINRSTLALFAGASGDHNPIHIDIDFAREAGMEDVFAHGMLSMAYLSRALTEWVPQHRIISYGARFATITQLGDRIRCNGKVVEIFNRGTNPCARIKLTAVRQGAEIALFGEALVKLD